MGQRHQIYVVKKDKHGYTGLGAFHHQWKYGMSAITAFTQLYLILKKYPYSSYMLDDRRLNTAVSSAYGISPNGNISIIHNETKFLIDDGVIEPEKGDNNDGCSLIIVDNIKKEIRGCLFTPQHLEGQYYKDSHGRNKALTREKYLSYYYNKKDQDERGFKKEFKHELKLIRNTNIKKISTQELKKVLKKNEVTSIGNYKFNQQIDGTFKRVGE